MIDSNEILEVLCGPGDVATFKEVMRTSMNLARVVKAVIAEDLDGSLPPHGKQFLTTKRGMWRLAARANTDNTTEERSHRQMGAGLVQVFDDISPERRKRGWIGVAELYEIHRVRYDQEEMLRRIRDRFQ